MIYTWSCIIHVCVASDHLADPKDDAPDTQHWKSLSLSHFLDVTSSFPVLSIKQEDLSLAQQVGCPWISALVTVQSGKNGARST